MNALIIKTSEFEVDTLSGSYIAVLSNGDMYRYGVYSPNFKILIKKVKVNDNEKSKFLELIENVNTLDPAQLNLKNIVMKDGTKATIDIDHGFLYGLDVYQGKNLYISNPLVLIILLPKRWTDIKCGRNL